MLWEEIMKNSPTMKKIIEDKIAEDMNEFKKQTQEIMVYQELQNRILSYKIKKLEGGTL